MAANPDIVDFLNRLDSLFNYAAANPPGLGILCNRLDKFLKEIQQDFPADQKTLETYKPLIAEANKAYIAAVKENTERELKFVWGEEVGQKKYAKACERLVAFELKHGR